MKKILLHLFIFFWSLGAHAQIYTIQSLIDSYRSSAPTTISQNHIDWLFTYHRPRLDELIILADLDHDKFKIRTRAYVEGYVRGPSDFIKLYSGVTPIRINDEAVSWLLKHPETNIDIVIALADLEMDRFKVRNRAISAKLVTSIAELTKLYEGVAPVLFDVETIRSYLGQTVTYEQLKKFLSIASNHSYIIRYINQNRILDYSSLQSLAVLPSNVYDFWDNLPDDKERSIFFPDEKAPYELNEISEKLYAVHATDFYPANGRVKVIFPEVRTEKNFFRPTTHFALGELVRGHGNGKYTWDNKKFAIVTPIKSILPQMISLNTYDSFILGDFKLTKDSVLIYPTGARSIVEKGPFAVVEFDPRRVKLRSVVEEVIRNRGGWSVRMQEDASQIAEAKMEGKNINTLNFFSPILKLYPDVSFGAHMESVVGDGYDYGFIDMFLTELYLGDVYGMRTSVIRPYILSLVDFVLSERTSLVERSLIFTSEVKKIYQDHARFARKAIESLKKTVDINSGSAGEIEMKAIRTAPLSPGRLKRFIVLYPEQFKDLDLTEFQLWYCLYRITKVGIWVARKEGTVDLFYKVLESMGDGRSRSEIIKKIGDRLDFHLSNSPSWPSDLRKFSSDIKNSYL